MKFLDYWKKRQNSSFCEETKENINFSNSNTISLPKKIEEYLKWYEDDYLKPLSESQKREIVAQVKNFIDKMAIWYELRYPNYEVLKHIPCKSALCKPYEKKDINSLMFDENNYIDTLFAKTSDVRQIDWEDFYNPNIFIKSLPKEERGLLARPKYPDIVKLDDLFFKHLDLSSKGRIEDSDFMPYLEGKTVEEAIKILENKGLSSEAQILKGVEKRYIKNVQKKEGLLDSVMYNIIERGGCIYGPRRALMFAQEFGRDIDIPMMYGLSGIPLNFNIDLVNAYLKMGGTRHLKCFTDYFSNSQNQTKISLERLLEKYESEQNHKKEENLKRKSYQKLVNVLASKLDENELKKEEVKKKRLDRHLNKPLR